MIKPLDIVVFGQNGRMAGLLAKAVQDASDLHLCGVLPSRQVPAMQIVKALREVPPDAVVLDFSHADAHAMLIDALHDEPRDLVTGTSGLTQTHIAALKELQSRVVLGRNFSPGAIIAAKLIAKMRALTLAGNDWEAEVIDLHHAAKVDRPSATAQQWANTWGDAPISSLRIGDGISEHFFVGAGTGERLEVTHRLLSHSAPVSGALTATRCIKTLESGLHDVIELLAPA